MCEKVHDFPREEKTGGSANVLGGSLWTLVDNCGSSLCEMCSKLATMVSGIRKETFVRQTSVTLNCRLMLC